MRCSGKGCIAAPVCRPRAKRIAVSAAGWPHWSAHIRHKRKV